MRACRLLASDINCSALYTPSQLDNCLSCTGSSNQLPAMAVSKKRPAGAPAGDDAEAEPAALTAENLHKLNIAEARKRLEQGKLSQEQFCEIVQHSPEHGPKQAMWKHFEYNRNKNAAAKETGTVRKKGCRPMGIDGGGMGTHHRD